MKPIKPDTHAFKREYLDDVIEACGMIWGDHFISPGGNKSVDLIVNNVPLRRMFTGLILTRL